MKSWSDSGATSEPSPRPQPKPPGAAVPEATPQEKASLTKTWGEPRCEHLTHTHISQTPRVYPQKVGSKPLQPHFALYPLQSATAQPARDVTNQGYVLMAPKKSHKKKGESETCSAPPRSQEHPGACPPPQPAHGAAEAASLAGKAQPLVLAPHPLCREIFFFSSLLQNEQKTHGKQRSPTRDPAREVFLPSPAATHLEIWALPRNLARGGGSGFALRLLAWLSQHPFCLHSSGPGRKAL